MPDRMPRPLRAVRDNTAAREANTAALLAATAPAQPQLPAHVRLLLAQCDKFLADLEHAEANCEPIRTALLLGQAKVHLERMSDLIHTIVREPR